jgi:hypothetical protein
MASMGRMTAGYRRWMAGDERLLTDLVGSR